MNILPKTVGSSLRKGITDQRDNLDAFLAASLPTAWEQTFLLKFND